jgi:hypothetical protein
MWHRPFTLLFARSAPPGPDQRDVAAVHRDQRFNGGPLLITHRSICARSSSNAFPAATGFELQKAPGRPNSHCFPLVIAGW